jgi:hypothetical protein
VIAEQAAFIARGHHAESIVMTASNPFVAASASSFPLSIPFHRMNLTV